MTSPARSCATAPAPQIAALVTQSAIAVTTCSRRLRTTVPSQNQNTVRKISLATVATEWNAA